MKAISLFVSVVPPSERQTLNSLQENDAEDITNRLDGLKRAEKDRAKKIKDLENQIRKMQNEIDDPPELEDLQAINNAIVRYYLLTTLGSTTLTLPAN